MFGLFPDLFVKQERAQSFENIPLMNMLEWIEFLFTLMLYVY